MRNLVRWTALALLLVLAPAAHADTIAAGDFVRFGDRPGSPGGEFLLTVYDTPGGAAIDSLVTFCLQMTEYMTWAPTTFIVGSVSNQTDDVPVPDPLDNRTAWLYSQFRSAGYGSLGSLGYTGNATSANLLQNAIWAIESEIAAPAVSTNVFYDAANAAVNAGWLNDGRVAVLNLFYYDPTQPGGVGARAQDQLAIVSEPSSLLLFGAGLLLFARRHRKNIN